MLQGKEELFDRFILGKADFQEKLLVKGLLDKNPELSTILQQEQLTVSAIQNFRKNELKARLDKIKIPNYAKYYRVGAAVGVALLALTIYILQPSTSGLNTKTPNQFIEQQKNPAQPDIEQTTIHSMDSQTVDASPSISDLTVVPLEKPSVTLVEKTVPEGGSKNQEPVIVNNEAAELPSMPSLSHEVIKDKHIEIPKSEIAKTPKIINNGLSVSVEKTDGVFMYKFVQGKLYLYGSFEEKYEIIEWSKASDESLFLFYNQSYYEINKTKHEVTKLEKVTDESKIRLLKSFEKNQ